MLHTYTEPPPPPPRANAAPRSPNSNFSPPPKPPPFTAKTTKGPTPTTGSQKLARFHMPDARSSACKRKEFDDAKTKTSDFKAWEHMRHGSGLFHGLVKTIHSLQRPLPVPLKMDALLTQTEMQKIRTHGDRLHGRQIGRTSQMRAYQILNERAPCVRCLK